MRLDKFLKVSRIIKRRTVAKDFADHERVLVNGRVAKPSAEVQKGDILTVKSGDRELRYEILDIKDHVKANESKNLYRLLN
ncbi:MAG: RNA-binding S4 domain-containing protein [Syntrophomonadaceae bacterium]|nr:RNA-binding S4 domain-containing protein [Syntrophomonadaceae bacterium]